MKVKVRNRAAEKTSHLRIVVTEVEIAPVCPQCGGPRGKPQTLRFRDLPTGHFYAVSCWENPCGHLDRYDAVLAEASHVVAV